MTTAELREAGVTRWRIAELVRLGELIRVRKGRYVIPTTHDDLVRAARLGGRLDCVSLLRYLGVFVLRQHPLHLQLSRGSSRLPAATSEVVRHWRTSAAVPADLVAVIVEALAQACRCQTPREAIATLDSAWHLGIVDEHTVADVFALLPRRYHALRPLLDPRSESGSESIMRLILRGLGCTVDIQVKIHRVGRVDFVVDGWLIIECDSQAHHSEWEAQKRDRRRDLAAAALGYTTVRPIAEDILYHREEVLDLFRQILATGPATGTEPRSSKNRLDLP